MKNYEIMFALSVEADEARQKEVYDILKNAITSNEGKITEEIDWEVRDFAYEIQKQKRGHYYIFNAELTHEAIQEFERITRITTEVLRFLIVKKEA